MSLPSPCDEKVFLPPGGEMGELIRSNDWAITPLGPMEQWSQILLTNLATILVSPFPFFICWGRELTMLYNDAYIKLLGDKHVALGKSLLDVWPEARETIEPMIAKAFAGESVLVESAPFTLLRHGYPEETWFDFSFSPLRDTKGRVVGLLNTTFEMTKREKKLRESEERSRAIFEQTAVGMAITTPSGRFLRVNEKYNQLTGYSSDELLRFTYKEITHPDDLERDVTKAEQILSGEIQTYTIEKRYISKNGTVVWVSLTCSLVRNYAGEPDYFIAVVEDISERKQAEQRQREIEEKFSRVFEKAPIPTSLSRASDGVLVDVNRAWEAMFGVPRSKALGKTPAQLGISARPEQRSRLYAELEEKGSILNLEVNWYRTKENPEPILLVNLEVMELGGERYVFTTVQDITERKQAEDRLRESQAMLEAALSSMTDAVVITDSEGRFIHSNEAFALFHRFRGKDDCAKRFADYPKLFEVFLPDGTPAPVETWPIPRALRGESGTSVHFMLRRRDTKDTLDASYSFGPIRDKDGAVIGTVVVGSDITEQQRLQEELRRSRDELEIRVEERIRELARLKEILDQGERMGGMISWEWELADNRFIFSENFLRVHGVTSGKVSMEELMRLPHPDDVESVRSALEKTVSTGVPYDITHRIVRLDNGQVRFVRAKGELIRDDTGKPALVRGWAQDITELTTIEDSLRRANLELKTANRAKDEFLANMSHEIRTPVGEVIGMTDMLLQQDIPSTIRKDLEILRGSSDTILTLLNDLLDLSRIEQGKLELHLRPFPVREMIETVARPFKLVARDRGLEFKISVGGDVPEQVNCDLDRLGQVLKNLLSNALKFTERGAIRLGVELDKESKHLARLRFSVSDTGIGIPEEKQPELFQSFFQLDPSYSKKFAGAGLGLAISKKLVELMGGEITVRSTPGKGSCFSFTVSYLKAEETAPEPQDVSIDQVALGDLPSLKILLAEDNAVNRLFLRRALLKGGHRVEEAENGLHALEKLQSNRFDLVLMDIQMPEMDGVEATRRIRSGKHGRADIPIIALTAYAIKGDREKFLSAGMNGYVKKPLDFGDLARVISEVSVREESTHRMNSDR